MGDQTQLQATAATGPSAATEPHEMHETHLLDLPDPCLHHIVGFMDPKAREQFFRVSKGSQDKPGCAVLVLRACKPRFRKEFPRGPPGHRPKQAPSNMLHWAAQVSTDLQLDMFSPVWNQLRDILQSVLRFVEGSPATYPGITCLVLKGFKSASLIPDSLVSAFPNLQRVSLLAWRPDMPGGDQELGPVQQQAVSGITHLKALCTDMCESSTAPRHIAQQLSCLPALVSLKVNSKVFEAAPAAVLSTLTHLGVVKGPQGAADADKTKAALAACTKLQRLSVQSFAPDHVGLWLSNLPSTVPHLLELEVGCELLDCLITPHLLALPHLTSLTALRLPPLSNSYTSAPCTWRQLSFAGQCCLGSVLKLPLHTLGAPITCTTLDVTWPVGPHAGFITAIKAAQPHLARCGGIRMLDAQIIVNNLEHCTKQQAEELLEALAPCLSAAPTCVYVHRNQDVIHMIEACVARLWNAQLK